LSIDTSSLDFVRNRFPDHVDTLERLYKKRESFRSLCDDYRECLGLHERLSQSCEPTAALPRKDLAILLRELEEEILDYLKRGEKVLDFRNRKKNL
jgi:hypothetical protein